MKPDPLERLLARFGENLVLVVGCIVVVAVVLLAGAR